jgi:hypothetical protein
MMSPRNTHTLQCRVDPLAQDRLQWAIACLSHACPEMKVPSQSTIVRRALEVYVNYLGNIFATGKIDHRNVTGEQAHYAIARQNNPVYWPNGVFNPESVVKSGGVSGATTIVRFDLLEKEAKAESRKVSLKKILGGDHE